MRPADMLMRVGVEHYPSAGAFVREAMVMGASKRLPGVPTAAVVNVTRIFLFHPRAIAQVTRGTFEDLFRELNELAALNDAVNKAMCGSQADILAEVYATKDHAACCLLKKHGVRFHPGIFGYFHLAQLQGVVASEDSDVSETLKKAGVVPVFVVREREGGNGLREA